MGWAAGDWVGAPADRRLAFHDHSLRGGHPALLKHGRHPHGGMDLERAGWRGAALPRRCPARGAAGFAQRLVGARLQGRSGDAGGWRDVAIPTAGWTSRGWRDAAIAAAAARRAGWWILRSVFVGGAPSRQLRMVTFALPRLRMELERAGAVRRSALRGADLRGGKLRGPRWLSRQRSGGRRTGRAGVVRRPGAALSGQDGSQALLIKWVGGCGIGWARRRTGGRLFTAAGFGAPTRPCRMEAPTAKRLSGERAGAVRRSAPRGADLRGGKLKGPRWLYRRWSEYAPARSCIGGARRLAGPLHQMDGRVWNRGVRPGGPEAGCSRPQAPGRTPRPYRMEAPSAKRLSAERAGAGCGAPRAESSCGAES